MSDYIAKILIVDDDSRILDLLQKFLEKNGYQVSVAISVNDAKEILKQTSFDLLMLDVMMPGITGIDFAKTIKSSGIQVPIILLTALAEPEDRINGLESGADDYITKPFEPRELLLRAQKLIELYNLNKSSEDVVEFGNMKYNLATKELSHNNAMIKLTSTQNKLLEILVLNKGQVLSRSMLSEMMHNIGERSIDVQIMRLRNKIESNAKSPKFLQTIRHEGYILYI